MTRWRSADDREGCDTEGAFRDPRSPTKPISSLRRDLICSASTPSLLALEPVIRAGVLESVLTVAFCRSGVDRVEAAGCRVCGVERRVDSCSSPECDWREEIAGFDDLSSPALLAERGLTRG